MIPMSADKSNLTELLRKYDRPGPRYTSYPTAPEWSTDVGAECYHQTLRDASSQSDVPLSVYCHIPFCKQRCLYCGCNTFITSRPSRPHEYVTTLIKEIEATVEQLGSRNKVNQFHFGGGTPTHLSVDELSRLLDHFDSRFTFLPDCEKSIEIDPRVTTRAQLDMLASRGFNRLSIGVQEFDPLVQQAIGRVQPEEVVAAAQNYGQKLKFRGINFDLIYGLPRQTVAGFRTTIEKVIAMRPDRLAIYSYAHLPGMLEHQKKINPDELPSPATKYELFLTALEMFISAGYCQIGIDHFALPDDELTLAQSDGRLHRNFMGYTVQSSDEMIGFGMSAIGYVGNSFFQNVSKIDEYEQVIDDKGCATYRGIRLSLDDLTRQYVISNLMCNFQLRYASFRSRFGVEFNSYFAEERELLREFVDDGLLVITPSGIDVTPLGRTFVRNIAMTFDAYLKRAQTKPKATFSRTI
jgi:oxygen-independent coproporphyrinogen III oxidase